MKQNYRQAKRQKELARKARQQEKHHKRVARVDGEPETLSGTDVGAEGSATEAVADTPHGPVDGRGPLDGKEST